MSNFTHAYDHLKGRQVRIPKGTPIVSDTSPNKRAVVGRTMTVRVDHVLPGHDPSPYEQERYGSTGAPATVRWAGSGGYWRGVPASLVEAV